MAAYIINDQDKESIYPINFFVYQDEWRDIKIKEFTIEDFKDIKSKDYPKVLLSLLDDEA